MTEQLHSVAQCKESTCSAGNLGDTGLIPRLERFLGGGNGNLLQYSCWEGPMDSGMWRAVVHRVTKSQTQLGTHTHQNQACSLSVYPKHILNGSRISPFFGSQFQMTKSVVALIARSQPLVQSMQFPLVSSRPFLILLIDSFHFTPILQTVTVLPHLMCVSYFVFVL